MAEINRIIEHPLYLEDLKTICQVSFLPWEELQDKKILIIGSTGMIGSCLIDCLMLRNRDYNSNISIVAISRNEARAKERFKKYWNSNNFKYICHDCSKTLPKEI